MDIESKSQRKKFHNILAFKIAEILKAPNDKMWRNQAN